jgi:hypothetical protein
MHWKSRRMLHGLDGAAKVQQGCCSLVDEIDFGISNATGMVIWACQLYQKRLAKVGVCSKCSGCVEDRPGRRRR